MAKTQDPKPKPLRWKADEAWRASIQRDPEGCLRLFFPELAAEIDWSQPVEFKERELLQVARKAKIKKRMPDLLMQVRLKTGHTELILVHCEIQSQNDADLAERLFEYSALLYFTYRLPVLTLVLLAALDHNWHVDHLDVLAVRDLGMRFKFCAQNIWQLSEEALANRHDLFTFYTRAHRAGLKTRGHRKKRHAAKVALLADLYLADFSEEDREFAASMIDNWLIQTPEEIERCYEQVEKIIREEKDELMNREPLLGTIRAKYHKEGWQEGRDEAMHEAARRLLAMGLSPKEVVEGTQLSLAEVLLLASEAAN